MVEGKQYYSTGDTTQFVNFIMNTKCDKIQSNQIYHPAVTYLAT